MILKKFFVYIDDGKDVFKIAVPAKSKADAEKFCSGSGEVIRVREITTEVQISADAVAAALKNQGFGEIEMDLVIRTLTSTGVAE